MDDIIALTSEARVESYIADYYRTWLRFIEGDSKGDLEGDFDAWEKTIRETNRRHFSSTEPDDEGASTFGLYEADHDPKYEKLRGSKTGSAIVETFMGREGGTSEFYEYELRLEGGDWRLISIRSFFDPEGKRAYADQKIQEILLKIPDDEPWFALDTGIEPNCHKLFELGRQVDLGYETAPLEIRDRGRLRLSSGVLGAFDFGWSLCDFSPISRRVPPGDYEIQEARADGCCLAGRILFDTDKVATHYHPATTLEQGPNNHMVGVDYSNVAFFDAAAFMALEEREKDRLYEQAVVGNRRLPSPKEIEDHLEEFPSALRDSKREDFARTSVYETIRTVRMRTKEGEPQDCVVFDSGGDGAYPVYWGVDNAGVSVSLTVDFLIEFLSETIL